MINNRGNMGAALKDLGQRSTVKQLATSVVTASVASQIISSVGLSNVTESNLLTDRLQVSLVNAGTSAVVNTAINGGKLDKALENAIVAALAETLQGEAAQYIKGIKEGANANTWYHEVAHKLAHAAVGCAAASASKGKCQDGAMGAALGEVVAEILGKQIYGVDNSKQLNPDQKRIVLNTTRIIVGSIAALTHADVYKTVDTATVTIKNNYLSSAKEREKQRLIYLSGQRELSREEKNRLLELSIEDEESTYRLISACKNVSSKECQTERSKASLAAKTYVPLSYYHPITHQSGYIEIADLLESTNPDSNILRQIRDGYIESFKRLGFTSEEAEKAAIQKLSFDFTVGIALGWMSKGRMSSKLSVYSLRPLSPNINKLHLIQIEHLANQVNVDKFQHKNLNLMINGQLVKPIQELSRNAAVYRGLNDNQIFELTKQIAGISKLPSPVTRPDRYSISGDKGIIYAIKPTEGKLKGVTINLRNFSNSENESKARWTLEIKNDLVKSTDAVLKNKIELKFQ